MIDIPEIARNLRKSNRKPGLYVLSPKNYKNKTIRRPFKIGMSTNLLKRLDSYHLCFPNGFYIYNVLVFKPKYKQWRGELKDVETELHEFLNEYQMKTTTRRKGEWFKLNINDLKRKLDEFAHTHRNKIEKHINWWVEKKKIRPVNPVNN